MKCRTVDKEAKHGDLFFFATANAYLRKISQVSSKRTQPSCFSKRHCKRGFLRKLFSILININMKIFEVLLFEIFSASFLVDLFVC